MRSRRRALELLAHASEGCSTTVMFACGLTPELLIDLVRDGLAATTTEPFIARGYKGERTRLWITNAGRRALAKIKS